MRTIRFAFSLLMLAAVIASWMMLDWALSAHQQFMKNPDAITIYEGRPMTARTHLLKIVYPRERVGLLQYQVLSRSTGTLWAALYILAGLAGWCGSVWLQIFSGRDGKGFFPSLFLGGLAGLITYLIVTIVTSFMERLVPIHGALAVIAMAGGLFVGTFFSELEALLKALFIWLRSKLAGGGDGGGGQSVVPKPGGTTGGAVFLALAASICFGANASAAILYQCVNPAAPVCTASSEAGKSKCPHACKQWIETELTREWLGRLVRATPNGAAANFLLATISERVYRSDAFAGAPAKIEAVWNDPEDYGFQQVEKEEIVPGTIVILPNLTGVVTTTAADPLDATVLYPSAERGGKPNTEALRDLATEGTPKFVIPENVVNEMTITTSTAPPR